ncbi:hypothetical protein JCGZ_09600 [Jatropha curcas]|uniref:Major facilitator superfamily (MFS) profile domain-containing protein n=1 Tax=Jatropha curcas TaxID=180498 RepID=A0A067LA67_JATCU|nr:hypothetical protein JCGZ_09600 [Jatropha curcas]
MYPSKEALCCAIIASMTFFIIGYEWSSPLVRGFLCSFPEVLYNMGYVLALLFYRAFEKHSSDFNWRYSMAFSAIPSLLMTLAMLTIMPESANWLIVQGRFADAYAVVTRFATTDDEIINRMIGFQSEIGIHINIENNAAIVPLQIRGNRIAWPGILSDWKGRKLIIISSGSFFSTGAIMLYAANSFKTSLFARIIFGFGIGFGLSTTPVYIAEWSSPLVRGFLCSFPEVLYNMGYVLALLFYRAFEKLSSDFNWRDSMAFSALPSLLMTLAMLIIMPESANWLIVQGRFADAYAVVTRFATTDDEIINRMIGFQSEIGIHINIENNAAIVPLQIRGNRIAWRSLTEEFF